MKVIAIIGARPQFIKHHPFEKTAKNFFELKTIHTGQHYDDNMSQVFFDQLGMNKPDFLLSLDGKSHGEQTGEMLTKIEKIVIDEVPDYLVVYGDTNSTLAGALVASKLHIPLVHIEAGLRSYNKKMPEEINRVLTDHCSDLLFVTSDVSTSNLAKEGITNNIHIVGDLMKDLIEISKTSSVLSEPNKGGAYYYATLHRPYNVDDQDRLIYVLDSLNNLNHTVVFAAHPRTMNKITSLGIQENYQNIQFIKPQSYFENLNFLKHSQGLITDSGGMQKEAYWMQKQCITIRTETEWIETLENGSNKLVFDNLEHLKFDDQKNYDFDLNLYGKGDASKIICELMVDHYKQKTI